MNFRGEAGDARSFGGDHYARERNVVMASQSREASQDFPDSPSPAQPGFGQAYYGGKGSSNSTAIATPRGRGGDWERLYHQESARATSLASEIEALRAHQRRLAAESESGKAGYEEFIRRLEAELAELRRSEEKLAAAAALKIRLEAELERVSAALREAQAGGEGSVVVELRRVVAQLSEEKKVLRAALASHQAELSQLMVVVTNLREKVPNEDPQLASKLAELQRRFDSLSVEYTKLRNAPVVAPADPRLEALLREKVGQIQILEGRVAELDARLRQKSAEPIFCRLCGEKDAALRTLSDRVRFLESRPPAVVREVVQTPPMIREVVQQAPVVREVREVVQQAPVVREVREVVQSAPMIREVVQSAPMIREVVQQAPMIREVVQPAMRISQSVPRVLHHASRPSPRPVRVPIASATTFATATCTCIARHGHCCCCFEYGGEPTQRMVVASEQVVAPVMKRSASLAPAHIQTHNQTAYVSTFVSNPTSANYVTSAPSTAYVSSNQAYVANPSTYVSSTYLSGNPSAPTATYLYNDGPTPQPRPGTLLPGAQFLGQVALGRSDASTLRETRVRFSQRRLASPARPGGLTESPSLPFAPPLADPRWTPQPPGGVPA